MELKAEIRREILVPHWSPEEKKYAKNPENDPVAVLVIFLNNYQRDEKKTKLSWTILENVLKRENNVPLEIHVINSGKYSKIWKKKSRIP